MRAYLAVIKDSFRETLASRVLWILMALITILLLAIAPFSLKSEAAARLERSDFRNGPAFIKALAAAENEPEPSLRKQIVALLPDGGWKYLSAGTFTTDLAEMEEALEGGVNWW